MSQGSVSITPGAADLNNHRSHPPQIRLSAGSTVSWTNDDTIQHTVTSDKGLFKSGPISPGNTFDNKFDKPGQFGYHPS